jgi:uncharacterized protein (TIGR02646 family)
MGHDGARTCAIRGSIVIKVPIPRVPSDFAKAGSAVARERDNALAFFKKRSNRTKTFPFKAYKSKEIVDALRAHFASKCAYCESSYAATAPPDIEHYRPKGEIVEGKKKLRPGYYWLAVEWKNLLPSCRHCNSQHWHNFASVGEQLRGKGNAFPIANPKMRATNPGEERRERRLLLHPYLDDPTKHLEFTDDGAVRPARDRRGRASRMGEASIRVYGLDRPLLAAERRKRLTDILGAIEKVRLASKQLDISKTIEQRAVAERSLRLEVSMLKQKLNSEEAYAGMGRQFAERFLQSL